MREIFNPELGFPVFQRAVEPYLVKRSPFPVEMQDAFHSDHSDRETAWEIRQKVIIAVFSGLFMLEDSLLSFQRHIVRVINYALEGWYDMIGV